MSFNSFIKEHKKDNRDSSTIKTENTEPLEAIEESIPKLSFEFDRYFLSWLNDIKHAFFLSSYKTAQVYSFGYLHNPEEQQKLSLWITSFNRPMGMHCDEKDMWISSSGNLWKYQNQGKSVDGNFGEFDATYSPRFSYFGSDIDSHDICVDVDGNPYYCSATFSCICVPSTTHGFKVWWKPPWITKIASEDRCHLNGICSRDGKPRYVTSACQGNVTNAWRENRIGKGIVYDIFEDRVVCSGLTMPHSPRWHNGKLWVLEAGTGWIGEVDFETGKLIKRAWIPGFLRGICFVRDEFIVVGSSDDRYEKSFSELPLGDEMKKNGVSAKCGIFVFDLKTMNQVHHLTFGGGITEIYDVCSAPNIKRPKIKEIMETSSLQDHIIDYGEYGEYK